jgi:hypothetical protein
MKITAEKSSENLRISQNVPWFEFLGTVLTGLKPNSSGCEGQFISVCT